MMQIQTTLAQGTPWFKSTPIPQQPKDVSVRSARLGMTYRKRTAPTVRSTKQYKSDSTAILREYIAKHPGETLHKIRHELGWSLSKAERIITEIRTEVGNGYFLLKDLKP